MFQIELLSGGGVYTVYATDTANNTFLIYNNGHWAWLGLDRCRPYGVSILYGENRKTAKEAKDGHDSCD